MSIANEVGQGCDTARGNLDEEGEDLVEVRYVCQSGYRLDSKMVGVQGLRGGRI